MFTAGVILGLLAALAQAFSYIASRSYTVRRKGQALRLLALSHVLMGAASLPLVPLLWPADLPPARAWLPPLLLCGSAYLAGQAGLFLTLKYTDASRVSPMLGLKVVVLAFIIAGLGGHLTPLQWAAVVLTVVAAFVLNYSGGALPIRAIVALLWTVACYSFSDTGILLMIDAMAPVGRLHASLFGMSAVYVIVGAACALLLPAYGSRSPREWVAAAPFAGAWLAAMAFLFACFALLTQSIGPEGIVFGNILQATRGIISTVIAVALVRMGHEHLERRVSRGVFWRRLGATTLMLGAIVLFSTENFRHAAPPASRADDQVRHDRDGHELP